MPSDDLRDREALAYAAAAEARMEEQADAELGRAWREVVEALPEGWIGPMMLPGRAGSPWLAEAWLPYHDDFEPAEFAFGFAPTEALQALRDKLAARRG